MSLGIRTIYRKTADQAVTASTALVDVTGMSFPIAANQEVEVDVWLPFSVGAAGGFKWRFDIDQAPSIYNLGWNAIDGVTGTANVEAAVITAEADIANAWAVAGSFNFFAKLYVKNGATAGTIKLQMAQNSSDATPLTLLAGAVMNVTVVS